jgi:hypothetical protein
MNTGDAENFISTTNNISTGTNYIDRTLGLDRRSYTEEQRAIKELLVDFAKWAKKNNRKIEFSDFDKFIDSVNGETRGF